MLTYANKTAVRLAAEIKKDIIQLREAQKTFPFSEAGGESSLIKQLEKRQAFARIGKEDYQVNISREDYWKKILLSKTKMIQLLGGEELFSEIAEILNGYDRDIARYNRMVFSGGEELSFETGIRFTKDEYHFLDTWNELIDAMQLAS